MFHYKSNTANYIAHKISQNAGPVLSAGILQISLSLSGSIFEIIFSPKR